MYPNGRGGDEELREVEKGEEQNTIFNKKEKKKTEYQKNASKYFSVVVSSKTPSR